MPNLLSLRQRKLQCLSFADEHICLHSRRHCHPRSQSIVTLGITSEGRKKMKLAKLFESTECAWTLLFKIDTVTDIRVPSALKCCAEKSACSWTMSCSRLYESSVRDDWWWLLLLLLLPFLLFVLYPYAKDCFKWLCPPERLRDQNMDSSSFSLRCWHHLFLMYVQAKTNTTLLQTLSSFWTLQAL